MIATLYIPQHPPQKVPAEDFVLPSATTGFAQVPAAVAELLGCMPGLVDVLASDKAYVAYSIFDAEGEENRLAMQVLMELNTASFDSEEDNVLRGPVLVVRAA